MPTSIKLATILILLNEGAFLSLWLYIIMFRENLHGLEKRTDFAFDKERLHNVAAIVTGRRRGARILTLTFTRKHSMLIQHGGQHEPRAILFPTIPSVTTRGWGE